MKKVLLPLILFCNLSIFGCASDSTSPSTNTSSGRIPPAVGSTMIYHNWTLLDGSTTPAAESYDTVYVIGTNISMAGKSHVVEFRYNVEPTGFNFVNYESNGDISIYYGPQSINQWILIPLSSKGISTYLEQDSDLSSPAIKSTRVYSGEEKLTFGGREFDAIAIVGERDMGDDSNAIRTRINEWYDAATGITLKQQYFSTQGTRTRTDSYELISSTLK